MAEIRQKVTCSYCGNKNTVSVITKQTRNSRSFKVLKCIKCKKQNDIKEILNRPNKQDLIPAMPLNRVIRKNILRFCLNCNSTMPRSGFLMLFGKRYCDNKNCINTKPKKNYY